MYKVLAVDDEDDILEIIKLSLEKKYQVTCVNTAEDGLLKFKNEKFDIILTDLLMPVIDGVTFIKEIKKNDSQIPIICISGAAGKYLEKIKDLQIQRVLPKPIDFRELDQEISSILKI